MDSSEGRPRSGAAFTSSKCPPGQGLENSCELPFGFVWTPLLQQTKNDAAIIPCDADLPSSIICLTCLSYLNLYAEIDTTTGHWICPLCESQNVLPEATTTGENLLAPVLASPTVEFRQSITGYDTAVDTTTIIFVLDANLPREEALAVADTLMQTILPKLIARDKDSQLHIGLLIFGKNVSIYQLGVSGIASADVFATHRGLTQEDLAEKSYLKTIRSAADLECLWRCVAAHYGEPAAADGTDGTTENNNNPSLPTSSSRLEMLRKRKEERLRKQQATSKKTDRTFAGDNNKSSPQQQLPKSPWTAAQEDAPWSQPLRCTGEAVQCAIDLASMTEPVPRTARVVLLTNGCPNFGAGSVVVDPENNVAAHKQTIQQQHQHQAPYMVDSHQLVRSKEYFDAVARSAAEGGIGMDVLCTGAAELGIPAYQALVEPSSGYVLSHDSFLAGTEHLTRNLQFILLQTFMSGIYAEETQEMNWIDGCIVDLRMAG